MRNVRENMRLSEQVDWVVVSWAKVPGVLSYSHDRKNETTFTPSRPSFRNTHAQTRETDIQTGKEREEGGGGASSFVFPGLPLQSPSV